MTEYYLHEQVRVLNPGTLIWEGGKIIGKFFDFTDPDEGHVYTVETLVGVLNNIFPESLMKLSGWSPKACECGAAASKQPGHSGWCPVFKEGIV